MEKLTLSVMELAVAMGISRDRAYRLVKQPGFPAFRMGRRILIPVARLNEWLAARSAYSRRY